MKKIVFLNDFLIHDCCWDATYHKWMGKLLEPLVKQATGQDIIYIDNLINTHNDIFSRTAFYQLSGLEHVPLYYYQYDSKAIKQESIDYLNQFIDKNTFVIGIELGLDLRNILEKMGIKFINFWFHSYKLFDDVFFMLNTNDNFIYDRLKQYQVPQERFYFYANYWKTQIQEQHKLKDIPLEENSVLFVGQTFQDKSILKDGIYLNILNYQEKLAELSKQYKKIYYAPHPLVANNPEVEAYIAQTPYIEKLENISTYFLLTAPEIKKVIGISSSLLYEAQFFGKEVEYLYQPLFDIDASFGQNTFISIYNDYFNPYFWSDILSQHFETNKNVINQILFFEDKNKIRNIRNLYWGYASLDTYQAESIKKEAYEEILKLINAQNIRTDAHQQQIQLEIKTQIEEIKNIQNQQNKDHQQKISLEIISHMEEIKNLQNKKEIEYQQQLQVEIMPQIEEIKIEQIKDINELNKIKNTLEIHENLLQKKRKYLRPLILFLSHFIFKKKNRKHFRKKYMP